MCSGRPELRPERRQSVSPCVITLCRSSPVTLSGGDLAGWPGRFQESRLMASEADRCMLHRMTPEQKNLVQQSFALVAPIADQAGVLFYDRLFELDPTLRSLFRGDTLEQSKKLMHTLAVAVASLDDIESIVPALHALGRRHVAYGV